MSTTLAIYRKNFVDLDFSFAKHPISENVSLKKDANAIRQSVINLLLMNSFGKPFHPEIKSPIYSFLFENVSSAIKFVLQDEIQKYLEIYEPRISVQVIDVEQSVNGIDVYVSGMLLNTTEQITLNVLVERLR